MPERCGKVLYDRPNTYQEPSLGSVHAKPLEIDSQQGEQGAEGTEEAKIKSFGHM